MNIEYVRDRSIISFFNDLLVLSNFGLTVDLSGILVSKSVIYKKNVLLSWLDVQSEIQIIKVI
jgi:hypothetical protein